jgi:hypothetical protein
MRRPRRLAVFAALALACGAPPSYGSGTGIFRPLIADPRENQVRWHLVDFVEDQRYGSDIADSLSHGGWQRNVSGSAWEAAVGTTIRWRPLRRAFGWQGPWVRYQLGMPAGVFSYFSEGALLNTDYQFGGSLDVLWSGAWEDRVGPGNYRKPFVSTRFALVHRSSHLGDQYLGLGAFGRNQKGFVPDLAILAEPPVKLVHMSSESVTGVLSLEWSPPRIWSGHSLLRAYVGGEAPLSDTQPIHFSDHEPERFTSPAGSLGLEFHSAANASVVEPSWTNRALAALTRDAAFEGEWLVAVHVRRARIFDFATADDPAGLTEIWTPRLWTNAQYGRELGYHDSWHGMAGLTIRRGGEGADRRRLGPQWTLALEWYRGYSPNGQFLDQPYRYAPRFGVIPSLTIQF